MVFSPILGVLLGATLTIIIVIILVIVRIRRAQSRPGVDALEQKGSVGPTNHNTISSTKPLLRSTSPRDMDEKDPDVIPAKFGSPEGDNDRQFETLNGPRAPPARNLSPAPNYVQAKVVVPAAQWVSPVSAASAADQYHQYNNPVAMVGGTFPRESRPKDLRLGNGSSTLQRATDLELNGVAIKERLMANRLPESCV